MGPDDHAVNFGGEDIYAKLTRLSLTAFGAQGFFQPKNVEAMLTELRDDLPVKLLECRGRCRSSFGS